MTGTLAQRRIGDARCITRQATDRASRMAVGDAPCITDELSNQNSVMHGASPTKIAA
ncbi:hypothetical protein [Nocardia thailandica]